ncbi:carbohydrate ABC transporter permease [Euzebya sp.]|uniref:carbohydrate ABC transporter permease n=1 Tax=Euzebya sp. TaxID=1971409 RepID=UPI003512B5C2
MSTTPPAPTAPAPESEQEPREVHDAGGGKGRWAALWDRWPVKVAVLLIVILWLIPTLGLLINSFRVRGEIESSGWWTANPFDTAQWTLAHYREVLSASRGFGNAFLNSLAVSVPAVAIPLGVAAFAAYAFSWMEFKGRQVLFVLVVALLVVPLHLALIPILRLYTGGAHIGTFTIFPDLDLVGSFPALWLAHTGFGLPLAVYLLRNYIGSLPSEVIESAKVDGASHMQIFTRLIVPLSVPALAAFATLQFLWVWNDFLVALVFLGGTPEVRVLTVALADLQGARGQFEYILPAAAFVSMALPMVVFFALQRFFVRGLTAGAVKG